MGAIVVIVLVIGIIALYIWGVVLFFQYVALYVFGLGAVAMTGAVFVNYFRALGDNLFWGTGWPDSPHGNEPAFRQYFFRKAFYDYSQILRYSHKRNVESVQWVIKTGTTLFKNSGALFTWPLGVVFYAIAAVSFVPAALAYVAFGAIHLLLIVMLCAIVMAGALAVRFIEYASMLWRRIFLACPACYKKLSLPIYNCPGCGAVHKNLLPGSYGIFRRRCHADANWPRYSCSAEMSCQDSVRTARSRLAPVSERFGIFTFQSWVAPRQVRRVSSWRIWSNFGKGRTQVTLALAFPKSAMSGSSTPAELPFPVDLFWPRPPSIHQMHFWHPLEMPTAIAYYYICTTRLGNCFRHPTRFEPMSTIPILTEFCF